MPPLAVAAQHDSQPPKPVTLFQAAPRTGSVLIPFTPIAPWGSTVALPSLCLSLVSSTIPALIALPKR